MTGEEERVGSDKKWVVCKRKLQEDMILLCDIHGYQQIKESIFSINVETCLINVRKE